MKLNNTQKIIGAILMTSLVDVLSQIPKQQVTYYDFYSKDIKTTTLSHNILSYDSEEYIIKKTNGEIVTLKRGDLDKTLGKNLNTISNCELDDGTKLMIKQRKVTTTPKIMNNIRDSFNVFLTVFMGVCFYDEFQKKQSVIGTKIKKNSYR